MGCFGVRESGGEEGVGECRGGRCLQGWGRGSVGFLALCGCPTHPLVCPPPPSPVKFSPFEAFKPVAPGDPMELGPPQPPPAEGTAPLPIKPSGGAKKQKGGRGRVPR